MNFGQKFSLEALYLKNKWFNITNKTPTLITRIPFLEVYEEYGKMLESIEGFVWLGGLENIFGGAQGISPRTQI